MTIEKHNDHIIIPHNDIINFIREKGFLKPGESVHRIIQNHNELLLKLSVEGIPKEVLSISIDDFDFLSIGLNQDLKKIKIFNLNDLLEAHPNQILSLKDGTTNLMRLTQALMFISNKYKIENVLEIGMYSKNSG